MNTLEKLLFNLQTIAGIPKGKRISTAREFIVIDEESVLQPLIRWRAGDTRDKAALVICREIRTVIDISHYISESKYLYDDAFESADAYKQTPQMQEARITRIAELKNIRIGLREAGYGISNLCETYYNDANVIAELKPIIAEISTRVEELTKILIDIGAYLDPIY